VKVYTGEPVADYQFWPDHSKPGEVVRFSASDSLAPEGQITHYAWTFGDGTTGGGKVVKHKYASAGVYTVTLTVRDDKGKTAREEREVAIINPESKRVIYETDMCLDVDDVGGLAILHAMADRGEAEILAVCFNEVHPSGAAAIDAANTWYGRGDIPVGVYKAPLFEPDYSGYLEELARFPHDLDHEGAARALDTYRQVLSDQPDHSVTIISVGFLNNLNDLLMAEPKLLEQKVKELVIMGGRIGDGFNLVRHNLVSASQNVIENWPTPLVISQAGSSILTGATLQEVSEKNPVRTAYYTFFGSNFCDRPSWDQMAVLYGVRGTTTYFERITNGKGSLSNGYAWKMKPGVRSYLKTRLPDDSFAKIIESLMTVPPLQETPAIPRHVPHNWLTYHLAHPGPGVGLPGDPNPAYFYKGLYHLHYIYEDTHGFAFAHVSSRDMIRWQWHPTVLVKPNTGHGMFSGTGFFTREGQPAMIYHGQGTDNNYLAFALDDKLDHWSKPMAVEPKTASGQPVQIRMWDPDCWLMDDTYYAISGGEPPHLMKSSNLKDWVYLGLLLHEEMPDLGVSPKEDVSCPNMFKLGDKWMLLCISHDMGCRYYLGDFRDERYLPEFHAMMNWKDWDFFAPESLLTPDGRRVMWAWCKLEGAQSAIQSLPRELSLPADGVLRIKPLRELESLRYDEQDEGNITVKTNENRLLEKLSGDTIELNVTIKPTNAIEYGVSVFCDKEGQGFPIAIKPETKAMTMGDIRPPFELNENEDLQLRIFLDRSMVEVFINDRQAAVYMQKHDKDHVGIRLYSIGGELMAKVKGWKMKSIYTNQ
jgi:sucrose-6-phosphate hydrolase SacC (GH32 family)/PKD repeat protein